MIKRQWPGWFLVVLAVLLLPSLVLADDPSDAAGVFGPGEQLTYEVSYLGVTAGTAQITVGAETQQWGTPVWPIVALAWTDPLLAVYPVKDRFITYWDHTSQRTVGSDFFADENKKRRRQRIKLDHSGKSATIIRQKEGGDENSDTREIETGAFDVAAATFALRNRPLTVGAEFEFPIFTGVNSFRMKTRVERRETLQTAMGPQEVFRVLVQTDFKGKFQSKSELRAFFTADEHRLPVRVEADFLLGTLAANLKDFKPGARPVKVARGEPGS